MNKKSDLLEKLENRQKQLKARIEKVKAADKHRERKRETRRKILIGAYYAKKAQDEGRYEEMLKELEPFLTRKEDRTLFGFNPLPTEK